MKNLIDSSVVISTHIYATGPATDLRDYLIHKQISNLLFISHPLDEHSPDKESEYSLYLTGLTKDHKHLPYNNNIPIFKFTTDFIRTIVWVLSTDKKWDLFVGSDNLNAVAGLLLKIFGRVDKVIYYTIDYSPKRFTNSFLNSIYHVFDSIAVKYSDETWNLSPRMESARIQYHRLSGGRQIVVPLGIWLDQYHLRKTINLSKPTLVFMGNIMEKQGIQHVIKAIPKIIQRIPDFTFLIIGGGEYLHYLKQLVDVEKLKEHVIFTGFIASHETLVKLLSQGQAAIAVYETTHNDTISYSFFSDPGKIKEYLASGLPVILTDVTHNAKDLQDSECGIVIQNNPDSISEAVIDLFTTKGKIEQYRKNTLVYVNKYDWNNIFFLNLSRNFVI